jgi:hypothetical protein
MINCVFYIKDNQKCSLGFHGGYPTAETCRECIERGWNTEENAKELMERYMVSHPPLIEQVSGCCDSARNYIDR